MRWPEQIQATSALKNKSVMQLMPFREIWTPLSARLWFCSNISLVGLRASTTNWQPRANALGGLRRVYCREHFLCARRRLLVGLSWQLGVNLFTNIYLVEALQLCNRSDKDVYNLNERPHNLAVQCGMVLSESFGARWPVKSAQMHCTLLQRQRIRLGFLYSGISKKLPIYTRVIGKGLTSLSMM